jgi:hypothetical protein
MSEVETTTTPTATITAPDSDGTSIDDVVGSLLKEMPEVSEGEGEAKPAPGAADEAPEGKPEPETSEDDGLDDDGDEKRKKALSDKEGKLDEERLERAFIKLRSQERRAKERGAALESQKGLILKGREELDQRVKAFNEEYEPLLSLAKQNPKEFLLKVGWNRDEIAAFILNDDKIPTERLIAETDERLNRKAKELEERQAAFEASQQSEKLKEKARSFESVVSAQISELSASGAFPLALKMAELDAAELKSDPHTVLASAVKNYLAKVYKEEGKALAPKAAMEYFEKRLAARKAVYSDGAPAQGGAGKAAQPGAGQPRLLSNADTSQRGSTGARPAQDLDDDDSRWAAVDKLLEDANRGVFPE